MPVQRLQLGRGQRLIRASSGYNSSTQTMGIFMECNFNERAIAQAWAYLTDYFNDTQWRKLEVSYIHPLKFTRLFLIIPQGPESLGNTSPVSDYTVTVALDQPSGKTGFKIQFVNAIYAQFIQVVDQKPWEQSRWRTCYHFEYGHFWSGGNRYSYASPYRPSYSYQKCFSNDYQLKQ